jgi:hypothetical protein
LKPTFLKQNLAVEIHVGIDGNLERAIAQIARVWRRMHEALARVDKSTCGSKMIELKGRRLATEDHVNDAGPLH